MITTVFTHDFNTYRLSNDLNDNADKYIAKNNALYIITKDAHHPAFSMSDAIIAVPYRAIANVAYRDETGKALSDYILYKKDMGTMCAPPLEPPMKVGEYNSIRRYLSLVGEHISKESSLD